MQEIKGKNLVLSLVLILLFLLAGRASAQKLLARRISVQASALRLEDVLDGIARKCSFSFSYNSSIIPRDSLVSISVKDETVKDVLVRLLGDRFDYKETGDFIILRYAPHRLALITDKVQRNGRVYRINGYVADDQTGERISMASVYERKLLRSDMTASDGSFELKIKKPDGSVALTASKEFYRDTTVMILSPVDIKPATLVDNDYYYSNDTGSPAAEKTALGRLLVSYKQKIQDLNVPGFIAESPVQISLTPGLSSHGMLSGQVVNKFSLNVLGGYTAGVEGLEAGGLFNINKKNVKAVQVAGLINLVGRSVNGVQAAGLFNGVLGGVNGVQVAGFANIVNGAAYGVQCAGLFNVDRDSVSGIQTGGLGNFAFKTMEGIQTAGLVNISGGKVRGVQVAGIINATPEEISGIQLAGLVNFGASALRGAQIGLLNITKAQQGFQLGLVNIADTSSGVSLGLVNLVKKGIHSVSFSSNEISYENVELRTGTARFYTILQAGNDWFGFGFGKRTKVSGRFYFHPELLGFYLYQGNRDDTNSGARINTNLSFRINRFVSLFAGPAFNVFYSDQKVPVGGHELITDRLKTFEIYGNDKLRGWIGWNAGFLLF